MAFTSYSAVLLHNGDKQILPVSKANLIELVNSYKTSFGGAVEVQTALAYLANTYIPNATQEAKDYTDAKIEALDLSEVTDSGKAIVRISQTDGLVAAYTGNVNAQYVDVTDGTTNYGENGGSVEGVLSYLKSQLDSARSEGVITVERSTFDTSYAAVYTVKQNGSAVGDAINIPLDLVATTGTLVNSRPRTTGDGEGSGNIAGTYISMSIAHGDPFYIDVKDLIEYNTFTDSTEINFTDTNHNITAEIGTIASSKISYNNSTVETELTTINSEIDTLKGNDTVSGSVSKSIKDAVEALDSTAATAKTENGFTYVLTGVEEADGLLTNTTYAALSDDNIKTTIASTDALYTLANRDPQHPKDISYVKDALNTLASEISAAQGDAVTAVSYTQNNTYVNVGSDTAISNNTLTIAIDDSALGNVSHLQYDELSGSGVEAFTLFGAND